MNVVDSSGWLEFFAGGPNARFFEGPITDLENLVVPSITLTEVFRAVLRQRGEDEALMAAATMKQARVVDLDSYLAVQSARIGIERKLPLADSIVLATALEYSAVLWTQDSDFAGMPEVRFRPKA